MPKKPLKPCGYPGCNALTRERHCPLHKSISAKEYERYRRDPKTAKRYGREWRHIRAAYIRLHPLCEQCQKEGRTTPVQEVHHIVPLSEGGTHDFNNLMSLCKSCHSKFTAAEWSRFRG